MLIAKEPQYSDLSSELQKCWTNVSKDFDVKEGCIPIARGAAEYHWIFPQKATTKV